jgi:hypothetical protein
MKAIIMIIGMMFITFSGCEYSVSYMEPNCRDGIMNGNETGVDCGGDCIGCWECGHFCEIMAGCSSLEEPCYQIWTADPPDVGFYSHVVWEDYYFYNTGKLMIIGLYLWNPDNLPDTTYGYWIFDDPEEPHEIGFSYSTVRPKYLDEYNYKPFIRLGSDTLMWNIYYLDPDPEIFLLVKQN